jgi:excinuclease UvrABC nuclease subunit
VLFYFMKLDNTFFQKISPNPLGHSCSCGVYAVCMRIVDKDTFSLSQEEVLYIGSSKNISKRVNSQNHLYRKLYLEFELNLVYIKYFTCEDYIQLEKNLIAIYKPKHNKYGKA